jgi:peptidoglycan L-alanyl-D-glutamate endopeptidase CwlK
MLLPQRSLDKLAKVHPDLRMVILAAAVDTPLQFIVTEGMRSYERQLELFREKKSRTMNSRHLTGHAVDIAVWEDMDEDKVVGVNELSWKFSKYAEIAEHVKAVAHELGVEIIWGGDFRNFKDGPHFELSHAKYPKEEPWPGQTP